MLRVRSEQVTIEAGTAKWFCSCGQSKKFPFCDGSHKEYNAAHGTNFASIKVEAPEGEARDVWACMCGHSKNRPFCDGACHGQRAVASDGRAKHDHLRAVGSLITAQAMRLFIADTRPAALCSVTAGSHKRVVKVVTGEAAAATAETKVATA